MDSQNGIMSCNDIIFLLILFFFPTPPLIFITICLPFPQILGGFLATTPTSDGQVISWSYNNAIKLVILKRFP